MRRMKLMAPPDHKGQEEEIVVHVDFGLQQLIQLLHRRRTGVQRTHFSLKSWLLAEEMFLIIETYHFKAIFLK